MDNEAEQETQITFVERRKAEIKNDCIALKHKHVNIFISKAIK